MPKNTIVAYSASPAFLASHYGNAEATARDPSPAPIVTATATAYRHRERIARRGDGPRVISVRANRTARP